MFKVVYPAGGKGITQAEYDAFVRSLTPEELSQNKYDNPNKSGYEELVDAMEEEKWYSERGYHSPYFREDIQEAREHKKGYKD